MIQAYCGDRLVIGVTRGNIDRLTSGQPMRVQFVDHVQVREVLVVFGEDKPSLLRQLESAGLEFADAHKAAAAADPL